jgi:CP family cyanate transporter-like MFS transporter
VDFGASPEAVGRLTAMAMSVGYLMASVGPVAIGWLRDLTGSFELPIALLAALVIVFTLPALRLPAAGAKAAT